MHGIGNVLPIDRLSVMFSYQLGWCTCKSILLLPFPAAIYSYYATPPKKCFLLLEDLTPWRSENITQTMLQWLNFHWFSKIFLFKIQVVNMYVGFLKLSKAINYPSIKNFQMQYKKIPKFFCLCYFTWYFHLSITVFYI